MTTSPARTAGLVTFLFPVETPLFISINLSYSMSHL
jgi:hypothetical protein